MVFFSYNCSDKSDWNYFLLSFVFHIILIGGFAVFFIFSNSFSKDYIIKPYYGSPISLMLVSEKKHRDNKNVVNKEVKSTSKVETKLQNYPVDNRANIKVNKVYNSPNSSKKSIANNGTGGSGNEVSEIIPVLKEGDYLHCIPPIYPQSSLSLKEEGTVIIRLLLNSEGVIINKILYKSSGFSRLDKAAMESTNLWSVKNSPYITSWVEVVINFIIR